ncbi:MAG: Ig-like domain repeat protein [Treponema sp.]|nr:Ig-like domain repeat protein [Treponema sp.]
MKKTLFAVLAVPLLFCACNFQNLTVPKEVEVKTGATYEFNLLKLDSTKQEWLDFSKYLDIGKMISGQSEGSGSSSGLSLEILNYNDGSDYQQLLMHMPLQKIDFNIGEQFKNMDFSKQIQGFDLNEEIVIPKLTGLNQEKEIDLTNLQNTINGAVSFGGVSAPSLSVLFVSGSYFDSVEYTSGSIEVAPYDGGTLTGTVSLCDGETVISSATFSDNKANLPLEGRTIKSSGMKIKFSDPTGTQFKAIIKNGKIHIATGVTIPDGQVTVTKPKVSFDMPLSSNIKQCVVDNGSIKVEFPTPTNWQPANVINIYPITISGGLDINIPDGNPVSLNNKVLVPSAIEATADVDLNLTDATIDFSNPPKLKVILEIGEITPTVQLPDSYQASYDKDDISLAELAKYVTSISLNPSGFDVTVKNNLPAVAENEISLTMSSTFLGMASTTEEFAAGTTTSEPAHYLGTAQSNKAITAGSNMDIHASIGLPDYDSSEKTITVHNVAPDHTYGIEIKVTPVFDWTSAKVQLADAANTKVEGVFESNLNKADLFKAFGESFASYADKIQFSKLPLYIYAQLPDLELFEHASFGGTIKAYYGKKDASPVKTPDSAEETLLNGNISLVGMPELTQNSEGFVTANLGTGSINFEKAFNIPAPDTIRDGDSLILDYSIKLNGAEDGELEIFKADLEKSTDTSISLDIVLLLTLQFNVTDDIPINLMEIMNKDDGSGTPKTDQEKDLFKRAEKTSMADYQKYLDVVKSAEIELAKPVFPFKSSGGLSLKVDWGKGQRTECVLKDNTNALIAVNPSTLLDTYPLEPAINLVIGKGTFGLPRQMDMKAQVKLRVKAEGPIQIYPFAGQEAN